MPRVAFVLRSTEVQPDCDELCHTKRKPVPLIGDSERHVSIIFLSTCFSERERERERNTDRETEKTLEEGEKHIGRNLNGCAR